MLFVAIALRIAITSENISFYFTVVKSEAFCIIAIGIFKFLIMWREPILPAAYFYESLFCLYISKNNKLVS